jgi:hypothetical protein
MQPSMLNEILREKRSNTPEIAILLVSVLGIKAESWVRLQAQFELDKARINEKLLLKNRQIEYWATIKNYVPVTLFSKQGILSNSLEDNIARILEIYNVSNINQLVEKITDLIDKEQGKEPLSSDVDMKVKIARDYLTKWHSRNQLKNEQALQSPK